MGCLFLMKVASRVAGWEEDSATTYTELIVSVSGGTVLIFK